MVSDGATRVSTARRIRQTWAFRELLGERGLELSAGLTYVCQSRILLGMRTTIRMNDALAKEVKRYAQKRDLTFTEVIERALGALLAKDQNPSKKKPYIPMPTFGDPKKKITWEELQAAVDEQQHDDDLRSLGLRGSRKNDAA